VTGRVNRMPPLINRGYYTRVAAIRNTIDQFLGCGGKQIVSLGAGYDTNYWRLKQRRSEDNGALIFLKYFEVDFPQVVKHKSLMISKNENLSKWIPDLEINKDTGDISSSDYALLGVDMRNLPTLSSLLLSHKIDISLPTLFLSECVLIYMNPTDSSKLISWTSEVFSKTMFIIYEQIHPFDAFGEVMLNNLQSRGIPLASIKAYPDLNAQKKRFTDLGYTKLEALDMNQIHTFLLSPADNQRISRLEIFDELEEWHLIQSHYCIVVATQDKTDECIFKDVTLIKNKPPSNKYEM